MFIVESITIQFKQWMPTQRRQSIMSEKKINHLVLIKAAIKKKQALHLAQLCAAGACQTKQNVL
jgi:hypothetical protein